MTARDFSLFDESPWLAGGPAKLGPARQVPTMLAHEEAQLLHWLTASWTEDWGAIVDLGTFAGGASARLAQGLAEAGKSAQVHGYDRFGIDEQTKARLLYPAGAAPFEGPDLLPTARDLLAPWSDHIQLTKGDLSEARWDGGAIEVLVVDASKSTATLDAIARVFYPALRPGSIIVHCGALHWREPWVMAQMRLLEPYFTPLAHAHDTSLVFGCTTTPDAMALRDARTEALSDAALRATLKSTRAVYEGFGASDQLDQAIAGLARSPGVRTAWKMVPPAAKG